MLLDYLHGRRGRPLYGFGESDYNGSLDNTIMGDVRTVFLVNEKSSAGLIDALRAGRMYAQNANGKIFIDMKFTAAGADKVRKQMGQTVKSKRGKTTLHFEANFSDGRHDWIQINLIRNGKIIHTIKQSSPLQNQRAYGAHVPGGGVVRRLKPKALIPYPLPVKAGTLVPKV